MNTKSETFKLIWQIELWAISIFVSVVLSCCDYLCCGSPLMVDLGVDILEALELKQVLLSLLVPDVLRLNELFSLDLGLRVTDLYVIALGRTHLFIVLQTLVSVLQVPASRFSEVVTDNTFDRRLWSIRTSKCELFIGQRNLISTVL